MSQYLLAHDLGTSGNKAVLYREDGTLTASALWEYPAYYPHPGWVEQDPQDWWRAVCGSTKELLEKSGVLPADIAAVSFSGQMMGCLMLDKEGKPLRRMIIWADTRAAEQEKWMCEQVGMEKGYRITGHRLSASYSAAKLLWVRDNEPRLYEKCCKLVHAKDYMVYLLTGQLATDYSDASGTNLLDINRRDWSNELLEAFGIDRGLLPPLHASADVVGTITKEAADATGLLEGTRVVIGGGDGSCACVGAGVVREGSAYNVLGSSSWISMAGREPVFDPELRTFNWIHLDPKLYTPCGTMQAAGYSYHWYRDTLGKWEKEQATALGISSYELLNRELEETEPGAGGLLYLPYLLGERSPRWNAQARGAFLGLNITTGKGELSRSVLEGVGFNLKVILDILESQQPIEQLTVIGGGAKGQAWMQILADIWQKPVKVPRYLEEATSMGAAICAGVGVGIYPDYQVAPDMNPPERVILPRQRYCDRYEELYRIFNHAYEAMKPVYEELAGYRQRNDMG